MKKTKCLLCGEDDFAIVDLHSEDEYYDRLKKKAPKIRTVVCKKCSFVYSNPQMASVDLEKLYGESYRPESAENYYKKDYYKKEVLDWKIKWILKEIKKIESLSSKPAVLDIGSGGGHVLSFFKKKSWITKGIEPTKEYAEYSRKKFNLDVSTDFWEKVNVKNESFDLVILANVLEHFTDPLKALEKIHRVLKSRGYLFIIVPNLFKPASKSSHFFRSEHMSYFTNKSIIKMLNKAGFILDKMHCSHYIRLIARKANNENIKEKQEYREIINFVRKYKRRYSVREKLKNIALALRLKIFIKIFRIFFPKK